MRSLYEPVHVKQHTPNDAYTQYVLHTHTRRHAGKLNMIRVGQSYLYVRDQGRSILRSEFVKNVPESNTSPNYSHQCTIRGVGGVEVMSHGEDWGDSSQKCTLLKCRRHFAKSM